VDQRYTGQSARPLGPPGCGLPFAALRSFQTNTDQVCERNVVHLNLLGLPCRIPFAMPLSSPGGGGPASPCGVPSPAVRLAWSAAVRLYSGKSGTVHGVVMLAPV
jgi:hypothetical protein